MPISPICRTTLYFLGSLMLLPNAEAADEVWKIVPHEALAVSVVRDMQVFSDKIDHIVTIHRFHIAAFVEFHDDRNKHT
jgi:hypothetical protein